MSLLKLMSEGALVKVDCTLDRKAAWAECSDRRTLGAESAFRGFSSSCRHSTSQEVKRCNTQAAAWASARPSDLEHAERRLEAAPEARHGREPARRRLLLVPQLLHELVPLQPQLAERLLLPPDRRLERVHRRLQRPHPAPVRQFASGHGPVVHLPPQRLLRLGTHASTTDTKVGTFWWKSS
jgi:hypothetical protein